MKELVKSIKNGTISRLNILYGEEAYLVRSLSKSLADSILPESDNMNRTVFSGTKLEDEKVIELAKTLPFFAESRLIILDGTNVLSSSHPDFVSFLKEMPDYLYIIICEESADKRNAVYKAAAEIGKITECQRQDEKTLTHFALKIFSDNEVKIRTSDMEYFLSCVGDDMYALKNEANKLISYICPSRVIEREDIDKICVRRIEGHIFDMVRAVTEKKVGEALDMYRDLVALKEAPLKIMSLITRQYNQLYLTMKLHNEGLREAEIAKVIGAPSFAVKRYIKDLSLYSEAGLKSALLKCVEYEEAIKKGELEDYLGVELLLVA